MDEPYRTRPAEKLHRTTSRVLEGEINHTIILEYWDSTVTRRMIILLCSAGFLPLGK